MDRKKILVVEDEGLSAMNIKTNISDFGHDVVAIFSSGEEAVKGANDLLPDLIIMDITLNGPMNGIQAAEKIRQSHNIPIVFLSAHSDNDTLEKTKMLGHFAYLSKPYSAESLRCTLSAELYKAVADNKRWQAERALQESEERYRTIANFTHDWEFWIAPNGTFRYVSPSCETITGYSAEAFEKDPFLLDKIVHPDDFNIVREHLHDAVGNRLVREIEFRIIRADDQVRWIAHTCLAVYDSLGRFNGTRGSNRDVTSRKLMELEREKLVIELQEALARVKLLSGFLPICAACKNIRDDRGHWQKIESYIKEHSEAEFTHGICPDCADKLYPDLFDKKKK